MLTQELEKLVRGQKKSFVARPNDNRMLCKDASLWSPEPDWTTIQKEPHVNTHEVSTSKHSKQAPGFISKHLYGYYSTSILKQTNQTNCPREEINTYSDPKMGGRWGA